MTTHKTALGGFSRRAFLRGMRWAPVLFLPAPIRASAFRPPFSTPAGGAPPFPLSDSRLAPHYPAKSPLDDVLRLVAPGADEYITEKYAFEITRLLDEWGAGLRAVPSAPGTIGKFVDPSIRATSLGLVQETRVRSANGIEVVRRRFAASVVAGRDRFLTGIKSLLRSFITGGDCRV